MTQSGTEAVDLSVRMNRLELVNPLMLAPGFLSCSGRMLEALAETGPGGLVAGPLTLGPRTGRPGPCYARTRHNTLMAMGLRNPGVSSFASELEGRRFSRSTLLVCLTPSDPSELKPMIEAVLPYETSGFEIDLNTPYAEGLDGFPSPSREIVREMVFSARAACGRFISVRLPSTLTNLKEVAETAGESGADAVTISASISAVVSPALSGHHIPSSGRGVMIGREVLPALVSSLIECRKIQGIPLIGYGGIATGVDVTTVLAAGASAVEVGLPLRIHGSRTFRMLLEELRSDLVSRGLKELGEFGRRNL